MGFLVFRSSVIKVLLADAEWREKFERAQTWSEIEQVIVDFCRARDFKVKYLAPRRVPSRRLAVVKVQCFSLRNSMILLLSSPASGHAEKPKVIGNKPVYARDLLKQKTLTEMTEQCR